MKRGYIYVGIRDGIINDLQISDTDLHDTLKRECREQEAHFKLEKLSKDLTKISRPERDNMMEMLTGAMKSIDIDFNERMKSLWLTNRI